MVTIQQLLMLVLLSLCNTTPTSADDLSVMKDFISAVKPTPVGWSLRTHFCNWSGVECDSTERVTSLKLPEQSLMGILPVTLNALTNLKVLNLEKNRFYGALPSLANLSSLWDIQLYNNRFTSIPTGAFSGLTDLGYFALLNNTQLAPWPFPSELVDSSELVTFYLSDTNMMGSIPNIFGSFPKLQNLSLYNNNLTGSLPSSLKGSAIESLRLHHQDSGLNGSIGVLCGMTNLSLVWLNDNHFSGDVPPCFVSLPNLKDVALQNNNFEGALPKFADSVTVNVVGNNFCTNDTTSSNCDNQLQPGNSSPPPIKHGQKKNVAVIIGSVIGGLAVVISVCIIVRMSWDSVPLYHIQQTETETGGQTSKIVEVSHKPQAQDYSTIQPLNVLQEYTFDELLKITDSFHQENKIGEGGFGEVYKGTLSDGSFVAVKRLSKGHNFINDYENEIRSLGQTCHVNLVKLLGYCKDGINKVLVYEYISNGSLHSWIAGSDNNDRSKYLSWSEKKNIILGMAQGLLYLHEKCHNKIIHRDLKPLNVLIDEEKNAKLCDFSLAKLLDINQTSTSTVQAGSRGYIAPEVEKCERITEKVDVYSYGVVVLQVLFGKNHQVLALKDEVKVKEDRVCYQINHYCCEDMNDNAKEVKKIAQLAGSCLAERAGQRPSMSHIVSVLAKLPDTRQSGRGMMNAFW